MKDHAMKNTASVPTDGKGIPESNWRVKQCKKHDSRRRAYKTGCHHRRYLKPGPGPEAKVACYRGRVEEGSARPLPRDNDLD
eukprot:2226446-Pyramimonas_sp.AAC.1